MGIRSIFDRAIAFFTLVMLFPLLLLISLLIVFTSKGPVIFRQKRIGKQGKQFIMYKFRTMTNGDNKHLDSVLNKGIVTSIGIFLRKWKMDELPELWNVIKGDMSIVGPRPYISGFTDKLDGEEIKILNLKPGLTSIASLKYIDEEKILSQQQIPGKYYRKVIYPDKVKLDARYYEKRSVLLDFRIVWNTLFRCHRKEFLKTFD